MDALKTVKKTLITKYAYLKTERNNFREILDFLREITNCKYSISINNYEDTINIYNITMEDKLFNIKVGYYIVMPLESIYYKDIEKMSPNEFKSEFAFVE